MAVFKYPRFLAELMRGNIDLDVGGDTIQIMLVNDSYVPSSSHAFVSSAAPFELTTTGYSRKSIASQTVSVSGANAVFSGSPVEWASLLDQQAGGHIGFVNKGSDAASVLMFFDDRPLVYPITFSTSFFPIDWHANGAYRLIGG